VGKKEEAAGSGISEHLGKQISSVLCEVNSC